MRQSFEMARVKCEGGQQPQQDALNLTRRALQDNQEQIDRLVATITSGVVAGDLLAILSEKAAALRIERERLKREQRRLQELLMPLDKYFDALPLQETLTGFTRLAQVAEPSELQQLLRLVVRRIEWQPDGGVRRGILQLQTHKARLLRAAPWRLVRR